MSTLLSKGYRRPQTGDRGFWQVLEDDLTQLNSHAHTGSDSEQISTKHLNKSTATIAAADWSAVSGQPGTFKQTVTVPSGYLVNAMQVKFYVTGGGQDGREVFPTVRKASSTTFDVFTNDSSSSYVAVYG